MSAANRHPMSVAERHRMPAGKELYRRVRRRSSSTVLAATTPSGVANRTFRQPMTRPAQAKWGWRNTDYSPIGQACRALVGVALAGARRAGSRRGGRRDDGWSVHLADGSRSRPRTTRALTASSRAGRARWSTSSSGSPSRWLARAHGNAPQWVRSGSAHPSASGSARRPRRG